MSESESMDKLQHFNELYKVLSPSQRIAFTDYFIGQISTHVSEEIWQAEAAKAFAFALRGGPYANDL